MTVCIVRTAWAGTSGGPGLTQTAFRAQDGNFIDATDAQTAVNAVRAFWDAIKAYLPNEIVLTVSPIVDIYEEGDGELVASETAATAPTSVQGTSASLFSMASGMKINLNTAGIRFGRRVRGAIYVVPAASEIYTVTGSVGSTVRTPINTAGNTMRTTFTTAALELVVWSRPRTLPTVREGAVTPVTSLETNEKVAILRGRRD